MTDQYGSFPWELLPEADSLPEDSNDDSEEHCRYDAELYSPDELTFSVPEIARLLNSMIMDIQHLELEVVRARYRLSFYLPAPYDEYMRMEIFSNLGSRYGGNPVYDEYLYYCGLERDEDAIDTPFHVQRMLRLSKGHDDYPDYYP